VHNLLKNFTIFMYVTGISRYVTVYIEFGIICSSSNRGKFWNVLLWIRGSPVHRLGVNIASTYCCVIRPPC
jgi:hypothetical protein